MTIEVGDIVTWRGKPTGRNMPLGIANCEVLGFGEAEDTGEPAALIRLPHPMGPEPVAARVADLHRE